MYDSDDIYESILIIINTVRNMVRFHDIWYY